MKTSVMMKRELFGDEISQDSKTGFFSATDLVRAGNKWRVANSLGVFNYQQWTKLDGVKEFAKTLEDEFGKVKQVKRGRGGHTLMHPFLFIDLALAINPKLKVEVYRWLYDNLLKYRNESGDSYKKMTGALFLNANNKSKITTYIKETARKIKSSIGVNDWETATEKQLETRTKMHDNIALLCDVLRDIEQAVDIGINSALKGVTK